MTTHEQQYSYNRSLKSVVSDELINTYLIRPIAGPLVRLVYKTPITPNGLTVAATVVGLAAAILFSFGTAGFTLVAGGLITLKDVLDSADGQLARMKQAYSRAGRFLDSIGDFAVNFFVFAGITAPLVFSTSIDHLIWVGILAFWSLTLRVSYHVYYHTAFLHLKGKYGTNRLTEEFRAEDKDEDRPTKFLHETFDAIYGWQDHLMDMIDRWSAKGSQLRDVEKTRWYGDALALKFSGFLGLGTELFVLMLFSVANNLETYLYFNLIGLNSLWVGAILYRRIILSRQLKIMPTVV